jgi:hypothetical protein
MHLITCSLPSKLLAVLIIKMSKTILAWFEVLFY